MNKANINERSRKILKALVARYIRDGQPVGSKTIAEEAGVSLSSATIRNIMADLEAAGYVQSPHTSAGRIPTTLGYRFFVNNILQVKQTCGGYEIVKLQHQPLDPNVSEQELVESASTLISNMTHLAGIVTIPRRDHVTLRHIEFLPLSHNRVLVILVLNEQEVQNQIIQTEREYSASELQQTANFLSAHYAGMDLLEIRCAILKEMQNDHRNIERIMRLVVDTAEKALQKQQEDYVIVGESNLLNMAEGTGVNRLRLLFDAFTQKNDILHLLDQCLGHEGIQIFIGNESGYDLFDGCSLITAPYCVENKVLGVLGVIGPSRMDYEHVISAVDVIAKLLSAALKERTHQSNESAGNKN
jgi:heat-inducible transcriptional repressor